MALAFGTQQPHKGAMYERGVLDCVKCSSPIHIFKINTIADEFSARCKKCGHRGVYLKRALSVELLPERRKKPRR
jgi:DNA-directed RNA polymerase subunit RPC12/RpoP